MQQVQKYVLGPDDQCALVVRPGSLSVIEHVVRLMPYVHHDKTLLLCFLGYIKNHRDLQEKQRDIGMSPSTTHGRDDVGATTASLISGLYRSLTDEKKEELLLAELQVRSFWFAYVATSSRGKINLGISCCMYVLIFNLLHTGIYQCVFSTENHVPSSRTENHVPLIIFRGYLLFFSMILIGSRLSPPATPVVSRSCTSASMKMGR